MRLTKKKYLEEFVWSENLLEFFHLIYVRENNGRFSVNNCFLFFFSVNNCFF